MVKITNTILILIIVSCIIGIAAVTAIVIWLCTNNNKESYTNLNSIQTANKYKMLNDLYLLVMCHTTVKNNWDSKKYFANFNSIANPEIVKNILNSYEFINHQKYTTVYYSPSENKLIFVFRGAVPDDIRMPNLISLFVRRNSVYKNEMNDWASNIISQYNNPTVDSVGYSFGGPRALEIFHITDTNFIPGECRLYSSTIGSKFIKSNLSQIPKNRQPKSWFHAIDRRDILAYIGKPIGNEIILDIPKIDNPFDTLHYHHARQLYNCIYESIPKNERDDRYIKAINKLETILKVREKNENLNKNTIKIE